MAVELQGGPLSTLFCKDVDNMLPFNAHSPWNFAAHDCVSKRSVNPSVSGASVLGIAFSNGVMICADILSSTSKGMARFLNCPRVMKVNENTLLGAGGDIADFQYLQSIIQQSVINDECLNDGFSLKPKSLHCWLTRTLYERRSKFDPLWNEFVVGGMQDGVPFLGFVNKTGTSFEAKTIATGFGAYLAQPYLRDACEKNPNMTQHDAQALLKSCMKILYLRHARSFPRYTLGIITQEEDAQVLGPIEVKVDWNHIKD